MNQMLFGAWHNYIILYNLTCMNPMLFGAWHNCNSHAALYMIKKFQHEVLN